MTTPYWPPAPIDVLLRGNSTPEKDQHPKDHNDLQVAVNAILLVLGSAPFGASNTLTDELARLTAEAAGGRTRVTLAQPINALSVVRLNSANQALPASSQSRAASDSVLGVAAANGLAGEQITVVSEGVLSGGTWPLGPLFLGASGELTPDPSTGAVQLQVAVAVATGVLVVRPQLPLDHL